MLSPIDHKSAILVILILTYAGIALGRIPGLKLDRTGIALLGAILTMIFGGITTSQVVSFINWSTIFLLFGFFVISAQLQLSGFYHLVAGGISSRLVHPAKFLLVLMASTAGLSAFLNHDIVCFVFAPIVCLALLRQRINPVPFLVAMAIASNVGSAATLLGNPQNMMIGQVVHLSFGGYLRWSILPVIAALVGSYTTIWMMSRGRLQSPGTTAETGPETGDVPVSIFHMVKGLVVLAVAIALFFTSLPKEVIALAAAAIHLASNKYRTQDMLKLVDWSVLVIFLSLFVVTGAFQTTGYGDQAVQWLAERGADLNSPPTLILAATVLSNAINNSAAVMLLLKIIDHSRNLPAFVLAMANSMGGSLLIVGSVANIIVVQQAQQLGVKITFWSFTRLGAPATLFALGLLALWCTL